MTEALPIDWRRSPRARRVSLRIDPRAGRVVVTLPPRGGQRAANALLQTHAAWIEQKLAALPQGITFADGAIVPIAGIDHPIRHLPEARGGAWIENQEIHVTGDPAFLPRRVTDLLRKEARRRLTALAHAKASQANLRPTRITVKDTKSRWGSCAANGALAFSWRLVMAPDHVQDYVAAHEVAHLRHMNHAPPFWALVAELTPHRAIAVNWLRKQGAALLRIG